MRKISPAPSRRSEIGSDIVDPYQQPALYLPSRASRDLLRDVHRLAPHDRITVCIEGPSGTGKTLYAEELHRRSPRRLNAFALLNVAAINDSLAHSELLGHAEGAFTGSRGRRQGHLLSANGGTVVLDELTKAPTAVQHILLSLLDGRSVRPLGSDQEHALDVRIVALTSTPLEEAVRSGQLIADLYERLKMFTLRIAPLSERKPDIPVVLSTALRRHAPYFGYTETPSLDQEVLKIIETWPLTGNHRELDGLAQRMLVNAAGALTLQVGHLPLRVNADSSPSNRSKRERYLNEARNGPPKRFATVREEARYYGVSVPTIYRWRQTPIEPSAESSSQHRLETVASEIREAGGGTALVD